MRLWKLQKIHPLTIRKWKEYTAGNQTTSFLIKQATNLQEVQAGTLSCRHCPRHLQEERRGSDRQRFHAACDYYTRHAPWLKSLTPLLCVTTLPCSVGYRSNDWLSIEAELELFSWWLCQLYTDFRRSFTVVTRNDLCTNLSRIFPPQLSCVVTLPEKTNDTRIMSNVTNLTR